MVAQGSASSSSISFGSLPGSSLNEPVQNFLSGSHASFSEHGSILNDAKQFDSYAEHFKSPKSFKKVVKCPFCINVAYVVDDEEEENISGLEDYVKCPMCVKHYKSLRSCYTHLNFAHAIPAVGSSLQSSDENKCNSNEQSNKSWKVAHKETASSKELEPVLSLDPIIPISNTSRVDLITQDVLRKPSTWEKTPLISNDTIKTKKRFFCNICGLPHSSKASLKRHSRINHENSFPCSSLIEETFKCPLCPEERRTYHHLLVHLQTRHSKWSPLKTTKKPRKELKSSMTALQQRAIKTKPKVEKVNKSDKFVCDKCPSVFTDRTSFVFHKRNHRSDYSEIGFECLICGWKTKWKTTIASHVRNNHPDDD
ncbi:zinc finger protein 391-like [Hydra vulgaris]|uniref:zinc finger protein 391-like n=1 Tax=Hydra vulgaris TaxID=6087 RepID=UPI0032EA0ED7